MCVCMYTWNADVVAEDETSHGGDDAGYDDVGSKVSRIGSGGPTGGDSDGRHFGLWEKQYIYDEK